MLSTLSKTFDPGDYAHLPDEMARFGHAKNIFAGLFDLNHEHRAWEYCICLAAAGPREKLVGARCLDVGGGLSVLPGLLVWGGAHVTEVDVSDYRSRQEEMASRGRMGEWGATPGGSFRYIQDDFGKDVLKGEQFDLVTCVSVIEHVGDDRLFFRTMLGSVAPGGTLALTTDFHPSGKQMIGAHNQCYNAEALLALAALADRQGFTLAGSYDYADRGAHIFEAYNFASLVLRRGT